MECFNCKQLYNESDHSPRLLINCGHSICEKCTAELYRDKMIICPECNFSNKAQTITCFPRNLALIHIKRKESQIIINDDSSKCQKHSKKYEAFCENDKSLLCVDCIITDGHQHHKITSLQTAKQQEMSELDKVVISCSQQQECLKKNIDIINNNVHILQEEGEKQLIEITKFYNEIRKMINEKEEMLKKSVKDLMQKDERQ